MPAGASIRSPPLAATSIGECDTWSTSMQQVRKSHRAATRQVPGCRDLVADARRRARRRPLTAAIPADPVDQHNGLAARSTPHAMNAMPAGPPTTATTCCAASPPSPASAQRRRRLRYCAAAVGPANNRVAASSRTATTSTSSATDAMIADGARLHHVNAVHFHQHQERSRASTRDRSTIPAGPPPAGLDLSAPGPRCSVSRFGGHTHPLRT